ncbi:MAG: acyl-CoA dehydrogenase family protein [Rhodococcus sp. (in: high G+C Gram-positive bacteria)]
MNFDIGDDRRHFAASIDALSSASDLPAVVRAWSRGERGPGLGLYRRLAELGVTGILLAEFDGGVDGDSVDAIVALERLGYWGYPGPMVETVAVAPLLLRSSSLAADLAAGTAPVAVASTTLMPRAVDVDICSTAVLIDGDCATSATASGPGKPSVDPARTLYDLEPTAPIDVSVDIVARANLLGSLGTAAYLLGAGTRLLEDTVKYATLRTQFGKQIGSFQAVAHALADNMIGLELARPLVLGAALSIDTDSADSARDVSAAKVACDTAAYRTSRSALQIHGAVGYTAEHDVSLHLLRIRALTSAWGTAAWHRRRIAAALAPEGIRR